MHEKDKNNLFKDKIIVYFSAFNYFQEQVYIFNTLATTFSLERFTFLLEKLNSILETYLFKAIKYIYSVPIQYIYFYFWGWIM